MIELGIQHFRIYMFAHHKLSVDVESDCIMDVVTLQGTKVAEHDRVSLEAKGRQGLGVDLLLIRPGAGGPNSH